MKYLICLCCALTLSGCWGKRETDTQASSESLQTSKAITKTTTTRERHIPASVVGDQIVPAYVGTETETVYSETLTETEALREMREHSESRTVAPPIVQAAANMAGKAVAGLTGFGMMGDLTALAITTVAGAAGKAGYDKVRDAPPRVPRHWANKPPERKKEEEEES